LLVVDDEPFNVIAIKVMCRDPRLWIDEAYNGQEALMKVRS
jgi:CheY-like chemotaxis protein